MKNTVTPEQLQAWITEWVVAGGNARQMAQDIAPRVMALANRFKWTMEESEAVTILWAESNASVVGDTIKIILDLFRKNMKKGGTEHA